MSETYDRYLFEYRFGGHEWGVEIVATSPAEAKERLKAISWANYKGQVIARIPASLGPVSGLKNRIRAALGIG